MTKQTKRNSRRRLKHGGVGDTHATRKLDQSRRKSAKTWLPLMEVLEERRLLTAASVLDANLDWQPQGPAPTTGGQIENITDQPVVGAVETVAIHPDIDGLIWVGTPNGGVWRSESLTFGSDGIDNNNNGTIDEQAEIWTATYATDGEDNDGDTTVDEFDEVHWTPLTDGLRSLSIGDIQVDSTDPNSLLIGIGRRSSFGYQGGPGDGVYVMTNAARPTSDGGCDNIEAKNRATDQCLRVGFQWWQYPGH